MSGYPAIDDLEVAVRTGAGIAIIVEGDTYADDVWFYGQWFNHLAREVTFFPQNGWARVFEAVSELRRRCPGIPVYGIIDRDFADDNALDADFSTGGILRTPRCTLENYLLEPECWAEVFKFVFRRHNGPPDAWDDINRVQAYIEQAYRACLALAAHNQVIQYGTRLYSTQASQTPEAERVYREHPDSLVSPVEKLRKWGQTLGAREDFGRLYQSKLEDLERTGLAAWKRHVSGKMVLKELHRNFPKPPRTGQFSLSHYLNEYLRACPDPPDDLIELVERVINHVDS